MTTYQKAPERTKVLSRHWFRRNARKEENRIQGLLDRHFETGRPLPDWPVPNWARGVRTEKEERRLGRWQVVATEGRGH